MIVGTFIQLGISICFKGLTILCHMDVERGKAFPHGFLKLVFSS